MRWYEQAAEAGHTEAQFELGVLLLADHDAGWCVGPSARWAMAAAQHNSHLPDLVFPRGAVSRKDNERAYDWLSRAAERGKPEAQANLGWLLLKGIGCASDRAGALRYLNAAAEHDIAQAAFGLAEFYGATDQPEHDAVASRGWLRRAADLGNASAAYNMGLALKQGPKSDLTEAEHYFSIASNQHHPEAIYELAYVQLTQLAPESDPEQALELLRKAAKAGHVGAAFLIGDVYSRGDRVRPDLREAAQWFRRAADAGHVQSQFQIGCFFAQGEGVPRDLANAVRYFEFCATNGHAVGAYNLGIFYENGQGVSTNLNLALKWLRVAADGGLPQAQVRLGALLASGRVEGEDIEAGRELLETAAAQDSSEAEFALAQLMLREGGSTNVVRAVELLTRATEKHNVLAAEFLLTRIAEDRLPAESLHVAVNVIEGAARAGDTSAMRSLAAELFSGARLPQDNPRAERLLQKAAALGDAEAHFALGVHFCQRNRTTEDVATGLAHYIAAANGGHALAQYNAAVMLLNGTGAPVDVERASTFLENAALQGLPNASRLLGELTGMKTSTFQVSGIA
ncbi:sel1 repeat family protein [Methylobacterium sp. J-078]|nr:sel1 repeat family protein [Methylobacterium sp. J-078]